METCKECGALFENSTSLHGHLRKHKLKIADYYSRHYPKNCLQTGKKLTWKSGDTLAEYLGRFFIDKTALNQYFDDVKWKKGGESSRLIPGEIHTSVNKADGKNEVLIGFRNISIFHTRSSHELEEDVNKLRTAADIVRKDIKYLAEPVISKDDLMDYIQSMIDKFGYIVEYHKFQSGSVTVVLKSPTNIELSADLLSEVASTIKKLENHGFKVRIREIISGGSAVGNRGSLSIAIINSSSNDR